MAITRVEYDIGTASINGNIAFASTPQNGDLLVVALMGGKDSNGIPTTEAAGPTLTSTTSASSPRIQFDLIDQGNFGGKARLSIFARIWETGDDERIDFGTFSGTGNGYLFASYRGTNVTQVTSGTSPVVPVVTGVFQNSGKHSVNNTISCDLFTDPGQEPTETGLITQLAFVSYSRNDALGGTVSPSGRGYFSLIAALETSGGNGSIAGMQAILIAATSPGSGEDTIPIVGTPTMTGGSGREWR